MNRILMEGIVSRDFMDLPCNCNKATKWNGECVLGGKCQKSVAVYKVTCTKGDCEMFYIGNTQQKLKARMGQHTISETRAMIERSKKSDTSASHFACHFHKGKQVTPGDIRKIMNFKVVWQGNPISCTKTFGSLTVHYAWEKRLRFYEHNNRLNSKSSITTTKSLVHAGTIQSFTGSSKMT